jgi:hypothetical protein
MLPRSSLPAEFVFSQLLQLLYSEKELHSTSLHHVQQMQHSHG